VSDKLNKAQKAVLRQSAAFAVENSLVEGRRYIKSGQWLGNSNRYRTHTVERLRNDTSAGKTVNSRHLRQYIAASAIPHCADGWSFLGRALDAHAGGDSGAALHFAYYAELRAAVCFLATRGIGIFNNKHFVITTPMACVLVPRRYYGTHQITWFALEHWADQAKFSDVLLQIVTPANLVLSDWLEAFHYGAAVPTHLGRQWLKTWGLDLRHLSEDRDARNEVSYRPTDLTALGTMNTLRASEFLTEFWSLLEPSASRFENVDRHLLRMSLESTFKGRTGLTARGNSQFENDLDRLLDRLAPPGPKSQWFQFLTGATSSGQPMVFQLAAVDSDPADLEHHLHVISRAALLLRVASGACENLLSAAKLNRPDLTFWWQGIGRRRGLWNPGSEPTDCSTLWMDIEGALGDELTWQSTNSGGSPSFFQWHNERISGLSIFGQCERIGLWGLGL